MNPAIRVEHLSKRYRLGERVRGGYRTLRDSVAEAAERAWSAGKRLMGGRRDGPQTERARKADTLWALRDVSFEVRPGEVVGIIGRNGAGKSTLLKILSRITEPTEGRVSYRGRLRSLLEVGTGFHPELTGRENLYLSGAILGMSKSEIDRKFDAIVDFAEMAAFLDTPIKRYSSGMTVRLGFAIAAHLDPDVLLLDEVLSVGDAGFRAKCIRKMQKMLQSSEVAVLFVSHLKDQIASVCQRCLVLHRGELIYQGDPESAWDQYTEHLRCDNSGLARQPRVDTGGRLLSMDIVAKDGARLSEVRANEPVSLRIRYRLNREFANLGLGVNIHEGNGKLVTDCTSFGNAFTIPSIPGDHTVWLHIGGLPFAAGNYLAGARLYDVLRGEAVDRHYQRYPIIVTGVADQHVIRLSYSWGSELQGEPDSGGGAGE